MARRKGPTTKVDPAAFDRAGAQVLDNPLEDGDRGLVPGVRVLGHPLAGTAGRAGRPQAGAPPHPLLDARAGVPRPTTPYVKSARVVGDCFVAGALVSTPEGLRPIEEIEIGDLVLDGHGTPVPVSEVYENPVSDLVRVTWSNGRTMLVTPGQRFRTVEPDLSIGWTAAKDLTGRQTIAFGADRQGLGRTAVTSARTCRASSSPRGSPSTAAAPLTAACASTCATSSRSTWRTGGRSSTGSTCPGASASPKNPKHKDQHILTFARHDALLQAATPRSAEKAVPPSVLADRSAWAPFIAGFFDGDGYVRKQQPRDRAGQHEPFADRPVARHARRRGHPRAPLGTRRARAGTRPCSACPSPGAMPPPSHARCCRGRRSATSRTACVTCCPSATATAASRATTGCRARR